MLNFEQTSEFAKDLKVLKKRWRSLPADIVSAEAALRVVYGDDEVYRQFFATNKATIITQNDGSEAVKMRLDCKSLGNDKKTRLVFVVVKTADVVYLVELYAKNDKDSPDKTRIKKYLA